MVQGDRERGRAHPAQGLVDDLDDLGVADRALGADHVEVALDELAEPPLGGPFAAENRADGVALEGAAEFLDVLGDEAGQRDGQVEPKTKFASLPPLVRDLVDLAEDLVRPGPLAGQDVHPLDVGGLDRDEAEARKRLAKRSQGALADDHRRGQEVPQPAGDARVNHGHPTLPTSDPPPSTRLEGWPARLGGFLAPILPESRAEIPPSTGSTKRPGVTVDSWGTRFLAGRHTRVAGGRRSAGG